MAIDKLPDFVERNGDKITAEMVAHYEAQTGKILQPAHVERLIFNTFAYRELLVREAINYAAQQNLVSYADAPMLDYLGELVGVTRLTATNAGTTLRFELEPTHNGVVIPAGTRVQSKDGKITFSTKLNHDVNPGVMVADVEAIAAVAGVVGNDYLAGEISVIIDPQPYIRTAANFAATAGGAEQESDAALRERIKLAPASYSNAGSKGAYTFHAKSANPSIIDVAVVSPVPGTVKILPLVDNGNVTPIEILDAVFEACNDDKIRPLTDTVICEAPERLEYDLIVNLTVNEAVEPFAITAAVTANLEAYTLELRKKLGIDVMRNKIVARCLIEGVYDAEIETTDLVAGVVPFASKVVTPEQYGYCTGITVNVIDINNG